MVKSIKSKTVNVSKGIAGQAAKGAVHEPLEVLKQAGRQISGQERGETPTQMPPGMQVETEVSAEEEAKIKAQGRKRIEELEKEIKEIREQKKLAEESLEEAQGKDVKPEPISEPTTEPSRKIMAGMKGRIAVLRGRAERKPQSSA